MIAIVILGLLACAGAAPHWNHHRRDYQHGREPFGDSFERFIERDIFDTERFWDEFSRNLQREMDQLEADLQSFYKKFPSMVSSEGVDGNKYKITIPLSGFDEKEIVVKSSNGLLMIQAAHVVNGISSNNYLDIRTLPTCVKSSGSWSYENNLLTIVFPLEKKDVPPVEATVTQAPNYSREETAKPTEYNDNVDVGVARGDLDNDNKTELETNEIPKTPKVEATTYAVDLKDEVEFVPINY